MPVVEGPDDTEGGFEPKQGVVAPGKKRGKARVEPPGGLAVNDPKAFKGYTLIAPLTSNDTYLIDMEGKVVRTWKSDCPPALSASLLENGHLLRAGALPEDELPFIDGAGAGGRVQEFDWDGNLVWDFKYVSDTRLPHHDVTRLPNGNVLMVVWERKTAAEAAAAGLRQGAFPDDYILSDCVIEVKPTGKTTGEVVWEWRAWDHIVQDHDKSKSNYGDVAAHPELVDVNFTEGIAISKSASPEELERLKGLGYLGGPVTPGSTAAPRGPDWLHINSVAYNADLDQIVLSVHMYSELWVIDHGTTTAEAAGHAGGRRGKGGDLLYRWGNPRAYRHGTNADRRLYNQHDARWIPKGHPGEGRLLVFNNGSGRPDGSYSSVDEIVTPVDDSGTYARAPKAPFGPDRAVWSYTAPDKTDFFSMLYSGAQRLPNGNTLMCSGVDGTLVEVTPDGEVVWKYVNPLRGDTLILTGHSGPFVGGRPNDGGALGRILPSALRGILGLRAEQRKRLDALQAEIDQKLGALLTDAQRKQFARIKEMHAQFGPPGGGNFPPPGSRPDGRTDGDDGPPAPGQILPAPLRGILRLSAEQRKQLDALQAETDRKFGAMLTDVQRRKFAQVKQMHAKFGAPGKPDGAPAFGETVNCVFTSRRYAPDFAGLAGKELSPGKPLEALQQLPPKK